jgi:hypothetical protein
MFEFIYLHDYGVTPLGFDNDVAAHKVELCLHANVYALGEKYEVAAMKEVSLLKFVEKAESFWSSKDFRNAVKIVFTTTADQDRDLRDLVARILSQHRRELAPDPAVEATVRQVDGLAYRLWKMTTTEKGPTCNACHSVLVRRCQGSHGKLGKGSSTTAHFLSCECEEEKYCEKHRNQPQPPQDDFWRNLMIKTRSYRLQLTTLVVLKPCGRWFFQQLLCSDAIRSVVSMLSSPSTNPMDSTTTLVFCGESRRDSSISPPGEKLPHVNASRFQSGVNCMHIVKLKRVAMQS